MNPLEALFLLESGQILIFHDEIPLSVAEAYQLLLSDAGDLTKYSIFAQLNRIGFFCLAHERVEEGTKTKIEENPTTNNQIDDTQSSSSSLRTEVDIKPLIELDSVYVTYNEALQLLRDHGPKATSQPGCSIHHSLIEFDVYRRESYAKKKPIRGKRLGSPDYHLIISDMIKCPRPNYSLICDTPNASDVRAKIIYAVVDADLNVSFVSFDMVNCDRDLIITDRTLPYRHSDLIDDDFRDF